MVPRHSSPHGDLASDAISALAKSSPPVAIGGATAAGFTLQDWVMILTMIYVVLQILYLGFKFARDLRRGEKEQADG